MDAKSGIEAVSVNIEAIRSTIPQTELPEFEAGLNNLGLVAENVGPLATTEALATDAAVLELAIDTPETTDVETELTPEQHERAGVLQAALAEKFSTDERKLTPEDFGLVTVGEGETKQVLVMLTTGNGLYHGSWNTIMNDKKANTIEIDGQKVDSRKAMTWEAYQALVAQADTPLPDSQALQAENGEPWTATWLTGEQADGLRAQYGFVYYGGPDRLWNDRRDGWNDILFRPAAVV